MDKIEDSGGPAAPPLPSGSSVEEVEALIRKAVVLGEKHCQRDDNGGMVGREGVGKQQGKTDDGEETGETVSTYWIKDNGQLLEHL